MARAIDSRKMVGLELEVHRILKLVAENNDTSIYLLVNMILIQRLESLGHKVDRAKLSKGLQDI